MKNKIAMSKRRHGGVWKRKSSKLVAKEGWSERESNIADFMQHSLEQTNSQHDLDIEWASSDEEDKSSKPPKEVLVQKVYKFNLNQKIRKDNGFCNFNEKLEDFGIYRKKKCKERNAEHKSSNLCVNNDNINDNSCYNTNAKYNISKVENNRKTSLSINFSKVIKTPCSNDKDHCYKKANSHLSEENAHTLNMLSTAKNKVDESDDEKEFKISQVILTDDLTSENLAKCQQEKKNIAKQTSSCYFVQSSVISETKSPTFKTQKHSNKSSSTPLAVSPHNKSPVLSSRRKSERKILFAAEPSSPVFKSKVKSASSSLGAGTQNIVELVSPVLKSKNLKPMGSPVLGSPVFNSRRVLKRKLTFGCNSAPNKLLIRDVTVQPHTEQSTRNVLCGSKKDSENIALTPVSRNEKSITRVKKKQRNLARAFAEQMEGNSGEAFEIKEIPSESEMRMELENVDSISNGSCSLEQNNIILENSKSCTADIEDLSNSVDSNLKMKKYISFLSSSQTYSNQSLITIEDVNETKQVQAESQISDPIEECLTPSKEASSDYVQHHTNKSLALALEENEGGQKGSEWLRALNQKTPERPSNVNKHIADPDSSKKRILKDGLASRLRRLMVSWQSSVQIWNYQTSIPEDHKPQTSACSMKSESSILSQRSQSSESLYTSDTPGRRKVKEKTWNTVKSPALKNLRCALLVGPTESSKRQEAIIEPPKKTLMVKIVKIDCKLPAGGMLCEKINSLDKSSSYKDENYTEFVNDKESSVKSLQKEEENQRKHSEQFIVIFAVHEQSDARCFEVNDQVIIYSPWQHLDLPGQKISTLFSSYYKVQSRSWQSTEGRFRTVRGEWNKSPLNKKIKKRKVILTSWSCLCSTNNTVLPTICEGRNFHLKLNTDIFNLSVYDQPKLENTCGNFKVIEGSSNKLLLHNSERPQSWSIVEAIEKCGGLSDIPVTVILHVYRIIKIKDLSGNNTHWLLIGADIMGIFCTVTIPDRPLAKQQLSLLLDEGEGTIRAFTQLTVTQRHTDNKSPGLFSLLHSLHHAYQKAIKENEHLRNITYYDNSKAPQSFCYNFTVTLGSTKSQLVTGITNIAISLPLWSVQEALKVCGTACRGTIFLHIIYKVDGYLYVICPNMYSGTLDQSLFSRLNAKHKIESSGMDNSLCKEKNVLPINCDSWVTRVSVQEGSTLPSWLAKNGTIMQGAIVRDIISYKGTLMVDGYSEIKIKASEVTLTLANLYHILPKLQSDSNSYQLVHVSGKISQVDEENAFSWPICEHCSSENLKETTNECLQCGKISSSPETGYSVEVFLDCIEIPNTNIKIKLYQRTIKKLISCCLVSEGEGYDATLMIGRAVGPLVCFIEEVKSRTVINPRTFILLQLPY